MTDSRSREDLTPDQFPTYPAGSHNFLKRLYKSTHSEKSNGVVLQNQDLDIAVVGAGVGGLSAAIALKRAGFNVTVYEAASKLGEVGTCDDIFDTAYLDAGADWCRYPSTTQFEPNTPLLGSRTSIEPESHQARGNLLEAMAER